MRRASKGLRLRALEVESFAPSSLTPTSVERMHVGANCIWITAANSKIIIKNSVCDICDKYQVWPKASPKGRQLEVVPSAKQRQEITCFLALAITPDTFSIAPVTTISLQPRN